MWDALTDPDLSERYFMGARVTVGVVGEPYGVRRGERWDVRGTVLVKEPPRVLRVTWEVESPVEGLPNCQVEYLIEPAQSDGEVVKLTVSEFVDGPVPEQFVRAGATGWALITSNLKTVLETGRPMPAVKLEPRNDRQADLSLRHLHQRRGRTGLRRPDQQ